MHRSMCSVRPSTAIGSPAARRGLWRVPVLRNSVMLSMKSEAMRSSRPFSQPVDRIGHRASILVDGFVFRVDQDGLVVARFRHWFRRCDGSRRSPWERTASPLALPRRRRRPAIVAPVAHSHQQVDASIAIPVHRIPEVVAADPVFAGQVYFYKVRQAVVSNIAVVNTPLTTRSSAPSPLKSAATRSLVPGPSHSARSKSGCWLLPRLWK